MSTNEREVAAQRSTTAWTLRQGWPVTGTEAGAYEQGHLAGSAWAQDRSASAQEPTDAEVRAVKIALIQAEYRVVPGNELVMIRQLGREDEYDGRARAAIRAMRAARRDEEKRNG